jgi:hypothetical protein
MQMTLNAFMKIEHLLHQQEKILTHMQMGIEKEKHVVLARKWFKKFLELAMVDFILYY